MSQKKDNISNIFVVDNFSSTTKLAESTAGSKESIDDKDDYNPFEYRSVEHPNSTTGALIHLLKSSLGSGILAMPNAFKNAGLLVGVVGTLAIGFLCTYSVHILVKASHKICKRAKIPVLGFSETAGAVFAHGPKRVRKFAPAAVYISDTALVTTYLLANCVYIVFISGNLRQVFDHWFPDSKFTIYMYMLFIAFPLLILIQVRELKHLVPFSFIANVCMIVSFGITLYYMFSDIPNPNTRNLSTEIKMLPAFLSTVIFAMEGIGVVMPVENTMSKPQHFLGCPGVLNSAMSIVVVLYATIGFFGYLKYGDLTEGSITLNLPVEEIPAQMVKLLIAISVFFTYFLQMYVAIDIIWRKFIGPNVKGPVTRNLAQVVLRCASVLMTIGVAAAVPDLEPIIGLVGSICFSTLGLLIPAIVETVLLWDDDLGAFKWKLIKNILLGAFSLFALVSGTAMSIGHLL